MEIRNLNLNPSIGSYEVQIFSRITLIYFLGEIWGDKTSINCLHICTIITSLAVTPFRKLATSLLTLYHTCTTPRVHQQCRPMWWCHQPTWSCWRFGRWWSSWAERSIQTHMKISHTWRILNKIFRNNIIGKS